jgi:hypothetical protein
MGKNRRHGLGFRSHICRVPIEIGTAPGEREHRAGNEDALPHCPLAELTTRLPYRFWEKPHVNSGFLAASGSANDCFTKVDE